MIPQAYVQAWTAHAPWPDARQVEQDLLICRALCDLYNAPKLKDKIAFRGGTAINKLLFRQALRYSEDIDLVQTRGEPIGATVDAIRDALAWLGKPARHQAGHSMHLVYKFKPEAAPEETLSLKVEINTREHVNLFGLQRMPFQMVNDWHSAEAEIVTFVPEELFGTKLRALLQRRKNRDLFDLHHGLASLGLDAAKVIEAFGHYLTQEGMAITRAQAEERMLKKLTTSLSDDIDPLLPAGIRFNDDDAIAAFEHVWRTLIARIKGDPWKLSEMAIEQLREKRYPGLLSA